MGELGEKKMKEKMIYYNLKKKRINQNKNKTKTWKTTSEVVSCLTLCVECEYNTPYKRIDIKSDSIDKAESFYLLNSMT